MFDAIYDFMMVVANWFWGMPVLVILIGGGLYLTICTDFVQFKHFGTAMKVTIGKSFGLDSDWAYRALKQVGNYAQIYDRNLGQQTALNIPRGLNRSWKDHGLMYAPPIR